MKRVLILAMASVLLTSCSPSNSPIDTSPTVLPTANPYDPLVAKDFPSFTWQTADSYQIDEFLNAAVKLQALDQDKAVNILRTAAKDRSIPGETVIVLCRMLFSAKPEGTFRSPSLGEPAVIGNRENVSLVPLEIVDGVPFLAVHKYTTSGIPESPEAYLQYCVTECMWGAMKYQPKTRAEKNAAMDKLLWKHPLGPRDIGFLTRQIE